jgi:hypothetical protein
MFNDVNKCLRVSACAKKWEYSSQKLDKTHFFGAHISIGVFVRLEWEQMRHKINE